MSVLVPSVEIRIAEINRQLHQGPNLVQLITLLNERAQRVHEKLQEDAEVRALLHPTSRIPPSRLPS